MHTCLNTGIACHVYSVEHVSQSVLSMIFYAMQYMGLYVFSLPISLFMVMRMFVLHLIIVFESEIIIISHETIICVVCHVCSYGCITFIPTSVSNGINYKIWDEIIYSLQKLKF